MRIFVTGANGHIGSAVVTDLLHAGHQVLGLARSDASADVVHRLGAEVLRGDVSDLDLVRDGARRTDATIHLAFAPAGAQLYAAAQDTLSTREIAETIARHLELPSRSISEEQSEAHFGGFATIMALDFPAMTSPETHQLLGWQPTHPGLIEDLEQGYYFAHDPDALRGRAIDR